MSSEPPLSCNFLIALPLLLAIIPPTPTPCLIGKVTMVGGSVLGSEDSESTDGDLSRGDGRLMKTTCGMFAPPPPPPVATTDDGIADVTKNPLLEVGVDEVSSLSEAHSGLELPLRLGPNRQKCMIKLLCISVYLVRNVLTYRTCSTVQKQNVIVDDNFTKIC